jgi:Transcriptional regulator/sugar kinase
MIPVTAANSANFKRINRKVILEALRSHEQLCVSDVSRMTSLSIATCANTLREMVEAGEALSLETRKSHGGRPARFFAYNSDHFLVASFFLKSDKKDPYLMYYLCNADCEIVDSGTVESANIEMRDIESTLGQLLAKYPNIRSAAISVPGSVKNCTVDFCDIPSFAGVNVEYPIKSAYGLEVVADNDMNFAAAGYFRQCPDSNISGLAYMLFPREYSYMGAGIIANGLLVQGKTNYAGELSRIPLVKRDEKDLSKEALAQYIAEVAVAVTAVINPDVIILSGEIISNDMLPIIRQACLAYIPAKHLPEFGFRPEYEKDSLAGMVSLALDKAMSAV